MSHAILSTAGFYAQKSLDKDTTLYRIFPLDRFKEMLDSKKIYFRKVINWPDTFEYPIRFMPEDRRLRIEKSLFGLCLSKEYDKEAMWKLYSGQDKCGICVKTTASSICNAFTGLSRSRSPAFIDAFIGNVKYVDYLDTDPSLMFDEQEKYEYPDHMYPAFLKRSAFFYENEVRILVFDLSGQFQLFRDGICYDLRDLNFIHEIILSPYYPEEKISDFHELCKQYGLNVNIRQSDFLRKIDENSTPLPDENKMYWGTPKMAYNILQL